MYITLLADVCTYMKQVVVVLIITWSHDVACMHAYVHVGTDAREGEDSKDGSEKKLTQGDPKEMMSYTKQAAKRTHCQKLACFVRLCDYVVVQMLHDFMVMSTSRLLAVLQEQTQKEVEIVDLVTPLEEAEGGEEDQEIPRIMTDVTSPRVSTSWEACYMCVTYVYCT